MKPHFYPVYGKVLRSEIPFPELRPTPERSHHWDFRVVRSLPRVRGGRLMGREPIYGQVSARLYRHETGFRIAVDDTGAFEVSPCGSEIRWRPKPDPWWDFGRGHLLGRVLATALHLGGVATLHGSAIRTADGIVAFLAPKGFGKSTLALRLVRSGAGFVTDDALPVEIQGGVPVAWPGVGMMRLEPEVAGAEGMASAAGEPGRDGKVILPPEGMARGPQAPLPLAAVYLLRPVRDAGRSGVVRSDLQGPEALMALLGEMKIGEMLGPSNVALPLQVAGAIASQVPVRTLEVVRDLDRLPEVVEALGRWHGLPVAEPLPSTGGAHA